MFPVRLAPSWPTSGGVEETTNELKPNMRLQKPNRAFIGYVFSQPSIPFHRIKILVGIIYPRIIPCG